MLLNRSLSQSKVGRAGEPSSPPLSQLKYPSNKEFPSTESARLVIESGLNQEECDPLFTISLSPTDTKKMGSIRVVERNSFDRVSINRGHRHNTTPSQKGNQASDWSVAGVVVFYLVAAVVMVFANKWVLRATSIPIIFLLCQLLLAVLFLQSGILMGFLKTPNLSWSTTRALLPLILINVTGLVFNTYCLQHVDASFYQIARGLILPFTVIASYWFLNSTPSRNILLAVGVVCIGFFWGVKSEQLHTSQHGIILGVLSSATTAIHAIIVKRSLSVTTSPIELAYYNNLFSVIFLLPVLFFTSEIQKFKELVEGGGDALKTFIIGAGVAGVFGFLICLAGFLSIKVTSPTTHMISSAVRGVLQTFLGEFLFGEVIGMGRLTGIGFILIGSLGYTAIRDKENKTLDRLKENASRRQPETREVEKSESGASFISIPISTTRAPLIAT